MAGSDVKSIRLTATGSAGVGPARIRQVQIKTTTGSPRITFPMIQYPSNNIES